MKSIDLLLAIKWTLEAWNCVKQETIQNCFGLCSFTVQTLQEQDDEDDPFIELNDLVHEVEPTCTANEYLTADNDVPTTQLPVDITNPTWREDLRENILASVTRKDDPEFKGEGSNEEVDDFDPIPVEPRVSTFRQALQMVDDLCDFATGVGEEELFSEVSDVRIKLEKLRETKRN